MYIHLYRGGGGGAAAAAHRDVASPGQRGGADAAHR